MIAFFSLVSLRGVLVAPPKDTQVRVQLLSAISAVLKVNFVMAVIIVHTLIFCLIYLLFFISFAGVYSRVTSALPWIKQYVKKVE